MYIQYIYKHICKSISFVYFRQKKSWKKKGQETKLKSTQRNKKKTKMFAQQTKKKNRQTMQKTQKTLRKRLPASKTRRLLQNVPVSGEVQRSLFVHHALMANIKGAFATIKKKKKTQAGNVTDCNWEDP